MGRIDREELRGLVRQALKEALAGGPSEPSPVAPASQPGDLTGEMRAALAKGKPARLTVAVGGGADLDRLARAVAEADASVKAAIVAGDLRFDLASPATGAAPKPAGKAAARGAYRMETGVLSELKLVEIARGHDRILIGSDVVMTPLARDKARELKVELVRQKP